MFEVKFLNFTDAGICCSCLDGILLHAVCCHRIAQSMSGNSKPICRFFNTAQGCREGRQCKFRHEPAAHTQSDVARHANNSSRGIGSGSLGRGRGITNLKAPSQHFHKLLHDLACWMGCELPIHKCQQWLQLALQRCSQGDAAKVLHVLKEADGQLFLTEVGQQAHSTVSPPVCSWTDNTR